MSIRKACVIGWPISHSRSPLIHGYWLKHYGIAGSYERQAVAPDELDGFLASLAERGFAGCNVTLPHKEAVFKKVRIADRATARLGVVNTVFVKEGAAWGTSTDGEGFLANLEATLPRWSVAGKRVLVLGAGGAARAIAGALADAGAKDIAVANRHKARAAELARQFGAPLRPRAWEGIERELSSSDLLVNATSLGMTGQPRLDINLAGLDSEAVVSDLVYTPLETPLIRAARDRGNPVVPGLGMLLHQAVRGFELWFGVRPAVTAELRDLVAADIAGGQAPT
jgi:shikimate dehydrogenase